MGAQDDGPPPYAGHEAAFSGARGGGVSMMVFHEDGALTVLSPDERDRPASSQGRWQAHPGDPEAVTVEIGDQRIEYRVERTEQGFRIAPR